LTDASDIGTTTRSAIRVVVRGKPLPMGAVFTIGDQRVLIVRRARPSDWPERSIEKGDLEGLVWSAPEDAFGAAATLQKDKHVIALRIEVAS
jgi:hypothetical protein